MTRGFRGATTVQYNDTNEILTATEKLLRNSIEKNAIQPEDISHIFFSVTADLDACFPAKAVRSIDGFTHVPVMCMQEIDVPNSLEKCIRMMLVAETDLAQGEVEHIFLNKAVSLRPDLAKKEGERD